MIKVEMSREHFEQLEMLVGEVEVDKWPTSCDCGNKLNLPAERVIGRCVKCERHKWLVIFNFYKGLYNAR